MAKWQHKYCIEDATDGRNGGAERTVRKILLEKERFRYQAGEKDQGAVALVLDMATAFERVSLPVVLGLGDTFPISQKDIAGAVRVLRAPAACSV